MKISQVLFCVVLISVSFIFCDLMNPFLSDEGYLAISGQFEDEMLSKEAFSNSKSDISRISCVITKNGQTEKTFDLDKNGSIFSGSVKLKKGSYEVQVNAYASSGIFIYSGSESGVDVSPMKTVKCSIDLFAQLFDLNITISPSGSGSVTLAPEGGSYSYNESVRLEVEPEPGYQFDHWDGDLSGSSNSESITMSGDKSVTAYFTTSPVTISGYVRTSSGSGIFGVTLTFSNGVGAVTTNTSGYYSQTVNHGWSGTITPALTGYTFSPGSKSFSSVTSDQIQDFIAYPYLDDNFESNNLSHWTIIRGNWSVIDVGGAYGKVLKGETNSNDPAIIEIGSLYWDNYSVEFDVKGISCDDKVVFVRYTDDNNSFDVDLNSDSPNRGLWIRSTENGNTKFQEQVSCENYQNVWYKVKVIVNGENIKIYVDDILKYDKTVSSTGLLQGKVRFGVWPPAGRVNYFDNILIHTP